MTDDAAVDLTAIVELECFLSAHKNDGAIKFRTFSPISRIAILNTSQLFTDCAAPFLTEGNAIQPDVLPIIVQKILLISAVPNLVKGLQRRRLQLVKVLRIL